MKRTTLKKEIDASLDKLSLEAQKQVRDFARALETIQPSGTPIERLKKHVGSIPKADLIKMAEAIEEGCENVYPGEW